MCDIVTVALMASMGGVGVVGDGYKPVRLNLRFAEKVEARGETLDRLRRAYKRLCSPPLDDLEFVLSDVDFKLNRRFTNYSGDISGRMLSALNECEAVLGCTAPMIDKLIAGFARNQKPDGHFGAEQNLDKEINQERDMALLWGNGRLLLAMAQRLARKPDPELREMAVKLGEYCIATRKYYGKEANFKGVGGIKASGFVTCYPSLIDGLAALGEVTGDLRFVNEAAFIAKLSLLDREFKGHHSHGRLTTYRGMLDIDRITRQDPFRLPVTEGRVKILDTYMVPTGGVTEYFDLDYGRDEGCSEADWLRVNLLAWQETGESGCLDVAEHVLRNHIHAMQISNGGAGHGFFRPLRDGKTRYPYGGVGNAFSEAYWCCSMHVAQMLAEVPRWGVVADDDRVYVTWLAEAKATVRPSRRSSAIVVTTDRTGPGAWTMTVEAQSPTQATLALRVPRSDSTITVDGTKQKGQGPWAAMTGEGGWVPVKRTWSGKTTLKIELPIDIQLHPPYESKTKKGGQKAACVQAGPDLYCLPDPFLTDGLIPDDVAPSIAMAADRPVNGKIPVIVDAGQGKLQKGSLVPMATRPQGGARWIFRVRKLDEASFKKLGDKAIAQPKLGTPVELEIGCDGTTEIYLNGKSVGTAGGWGECPQIDVYTTRKDNVLALKAQSKAKRPGLIGLIRVGGRQFKTTATGWTVTRVGDKVPAEYLTQADKGADPKARVIDVGPFGMPPWDHIAAEFLHSGARWIWAEGTLDAGKDWWLFRYRFEAPTKPSAAGRDQ